MRSCSVGAGSRRTKITAALAALALVAAGCHADRLLAVSAAGSTSRTVSAPAGAEIDITLQTIGPGEYASPPTVSSPAVQFLGVSDVAPYVPAGPTQRFRFRAASPGTALVTFRHTGTNRSIEDTLVVR